MAGAFAIAFRANRLQTREEARSSCSVWCFDQAVARLARIFTRVWAVHFVQKLKYESLTQRPSRVRFTLPGGRRTKQSLISNSSDLHARQAEIPAATWTDFAS